MNLRFPGQYFDQETGSHYNFQRYYVPITGRYNKTDPVGLGAGVNVFIYVSGSPLITIDPEGLRVLNCYEQVSGPLERNEFQTTENENTGRYRLRPGLIFENPGVQPDIGADPRIPRRPPIKPGFDKYIVIDRFNVWKESVYNIIEIHQVFAIICKFTVPGPCNTEKIETETTFKRKLLDRNKSTLNEREYEVFDQRYIKFLWPL